MTMTASYGPHTDTEEGQRACARGEYCSARETIIEDGERVIVPAATYQEFCHADREKIRACLHELPGRYHQLGARIGDRGSPTGLRVSGGAAAPGQPLNLATEAFQRQIVEVVLSWDERVRTPVRLADLTAPTPAAALEEACRTLAAHIDVLLSLEPDGMSRSMDIARHEHLPDDAVAWVHPAAGWIHYYTNLGGREAGIEVLNLHHRTLARLGLTPQHQDLITRCWACGERGLRRHDGTAGLADHVECLRCREQYLGPRLRHLMVEEDAAARRRREREHRGTADAGEVLHSGRSGYGGRP